MIRILVRTQFIGSLLRSQHYISCQSLCFSLPASSYLAVVKQNKDLLTEASEYLVSAHNTHDNVPKINAV